MTRRRETHYWLTVLATFALGTAAGDLTAASLHLGYLVSGILLAVSQTDLQQIPVAESQPAATG